MPVPMLARSIVVAGAAVAKKGAAEEKQDQVPPVPKLQFGKEIVPGPYCRFPDGTELWVHGCSQREIDFGNED
jgi:hypothetical protein